MTEVQEHVIVVESEFSETRHGKILKHWATCSCGKFKSKRSQSYQKVERAGADHLRGVGSRPL